MPAMTAGRLIACTALAFLAAGANGCLSGFVRPIPAAQWEPWPPLASAASPSTRPSGLADRALESYQLHLRRPMPEYAKGCRFAPSCSTYAREAFAAYGAVLGFVRTANRLFWLEAVADPSEFQVIPADGHPRLYDPATPPGELVERQ